VAVLDVLVDFKASKALRMPSFGGTKGGQDEVRIGPKTYQHRSQKRRRKKMLLKIVLERPLVDVELLGCSLGRVLGSFSCSRSNGGYVFKKHVFETNKASGGDLG